jgi:hypothetical protein
MARPISLSSGATSADSARPHPAASRTSGRDLLAERPESAPASTTALAACSRSGSGAWAEVSARSSSSCTTRRRGGGRRCRRRRDTTAGDRASVDDHPGSSSPQWVCGGMRKSSVNASSAGWSCTLMSAGRWGSGQARAHARSPMRGRARDRRNSERQRLPLAAGTAALPAAPRERDRRSRLTDARQGLSAQSGSRVGRPGRRRRHRRPMT